MLPAFGLTSSKASISQPMTSTDKAVMGNDMTRHGMGHPPLFTVTARRKETARNLKGILWRRERRERNGASRKNPLGVCQSNQQQNCPLVHTAVVQLLKGSLLQTHLQQYTPACSEAPRRGDTLQLQPRQPSQGRQTGCEAILTLALHRTPPTSHMPRGNDRGSPAEPGKWV